MRIFDGRHEFYQWDVNVKITSSRFQVGGTVHFHNGDAREALAVKAYALDGQIVADVPNNMLWVARPIMVYIYEQDDDGSRTVLAQSFKVIARPKPADYVYFEPKAAMTVRDLTYAEIQAAKDRGDFYGVITQTTGDRKDLTMSQKAVTAVFDVLGVKREDFTPVNILEGVTLTRTEGATWDGNGNIATTQYTANYTAINEKINVLAGHTYLFKQYYGILRLFYEDGTVGDQIQLTEGYLATDQEYVIPDGVVQIGLAYIHSRCNVEDIYRITPTDEELEGLDFLNTSKTEIVQETGDGEDVVMSQKAVTKALEEMGTSGVSNRLGDSKTAVMSQKAATDNFNAIREAFNVEGGYLNILDPENCESGYYDDTLGKVSSSDHIRTIEPIPVDVGQVYIKSNIDNPPSHAIVVVLKLDENGEVVGKTTEPLPSITSGEIIIYVSEPAVKIHVWISGASTCSFNNLCISTIKDASFEHYNAPPKTKALKLDMFPEEVKGFEIGEFEPINVLQDLTLEHAVGYSWSTNGLVTTQYTANYTAISPLIDVVEGCTYRVPNYAGIVMLYDKDGKNGTQVALPSGVITGTLEFTVPVGKAKVGIAFIHTLITSVTEMYRTTPTEAEKSVKNETLSILPKNISRSKTISLLCPLKGKVIVNFGDSIFGNARPPEDISTRLAELTGATVHNCGFGGCRMAYHPDANYDAFSMTKLADAITTRDFSLQENALTNTAAAAVPAYFADGLATLKSVDFTKAHMITIAYGTNDLNGVALDDETNQSFAGALRYSIETILAVYPHLRIFICSPTYRFWMDDNGDFTEDSNTKKGGYGYTTLDLIEKAKEVAKEYTIPFINNHEIGINKFNRFYYFPATDGAHHKIEGRRLIAEHIAKSLY